MLVPRHLFLHYASGCRLIIPQRYPRHITLQEIFYGSPPKDGKFVLIHIISGYPLVLSWITATYPIFLIIFLALFPTLANNSLSAKLMPMPLEYHFQLKNLSPKLTFI